MNDQETLSAERGADSGAAHGSAVVAHCVFCEEPLTRPGGQKWWIGGASHGKGLCYDCILSGMRVIMSGVTYAQEHGEGTNENPKLDPPNVGISDPAHKDAMIATATHKPGSLHPVVLAQFQRLANNRK